MKCTIPDCPEFAAGDTTPPLCPVHLDLDILVDFIRARGEVVNAKSVSLYLKMAQSNSANWELTAAQIEPLLPGLLAARYPDLFAACYPELAKKEPAVVTTTTAGQLVTPTGVNQ